MKQTISGDTDPPEGAEGEQNEIPSRSRENPPSAEEVAAFFEQEARKARKEAQGLRRRLRELQAGRQPSPNAPEDTAVAVADEERLAGAVARALLPLRVVEPELASALLFEVGSVGADGGFYINGEPVTGELLRAVLPPDLLPPPVGVTGGSGGRSIGQSIRAPRSKEKPSVLDSQKAYESLTPEQRRQAQRDPGGR